MGLEEGNQAAGLLDRGMIYSLLEMAGVLSSK